MAMTLRLTDEETAALKQAAEQEGVSMQELARKAVRQYVATWDSDREAYLARFVRKNKSLLDRLGQ